MKLALLLGVSGMASLSCLMAQGQACAQFQTYQVLCGSCGNVNIYLPVSAEYGLAPACHQVSCCPGGGHVTSCESSIPCEIVQLKDPAVRQRLEEVAEIQPLLIANCRGHYQASETYFRERMSEPSTKASDEAIPQDQDRNFDLFLKRIGSK